MGAEERSSRDSSRSRALAQARRLASDGEASAAPFTALLAAAASLVVLRMKRWRQGGRRAQNSQQREISPQAKVVQQQEQQQQQQEQERAVPAGANLPVEAEEVKVAAEAGGGAQAEAMRLPPLRLSGEEFSTMHEPAYQCESNTESTSPSWQAPASRTPTDYSSPSLPSTPLSTSPGVSASMYHTPAPCAAPGQLLPVGEEGPASPDSSWPAPESDVESSLGATCSALDLSEFFIMDGLPLEEDCTASLHMELYDDDMDPSCMPAAAAACMYSPQAGPRQVPLSALAAATAAAAAGDPVKQAVSVYWVPCCLQAEGGMLD
mmetsp:Transcript_10307/g.22132  ORF Transcript_10307/g.22132 Transcript_10307/m.22132 type:complete len:321 (+) Transcript_10307:257-1219(+)